MNYTIVFERNICNCFYGFGAVRDSSWIRLCSDKLIFILRYFMQMFLESHKCLF